MKWRNKRLFWSHVYVLPYYVCWVVVLNIFHVHPYLGKWSNSTNIYSDGLKPPTSMHLVHFWHHKSQTWYIYAYVYTVHKSEKKEIWVALSKLTEIPFGG